MSGCVEVGKCEVCGKEDVSLRRTYFHYDIPGIKCTCHSPDHFILIRHCCDCKPKEPQYTKIEFRTEDLKRLADNGSIKLPVSAIDISVSEPVDSSMINEMVTAHIPDATISIQRAMEVVTRELSKDKSEGSWYYGWQSNIACAIMDNSNVDHETANKIAKKFLDQLCAK